MLTPLLWYFFHFFFFFKTNLYWVGELGLLPYLDTILKKAVGYIILCLSSYRRMRSFSPSPSSSLENMCQQGLESKHAEKDRPPGLPTLLRDCGEQRLPSLGAFWPPQGRQLAPGATAAVQQQPLTIWWLRLLPWGHKDTMWL